MPSLVPTWMSAVDCCRPAAAIGCLYVYDLPLRLASTTCLYGLPLHLRPASTVCLYGLPSSHHCHHRHRHRHRPFPVQAENLSFSFICDLCFLLLHFLKLFSISSSKYAVEECDTYLLLTQSLPCYYCLTVFVLFFAHVCSSLFPPA
jgi:hypothetical protein